jgi:hypothetical protein
VGGFHRRSFSIWVTAGHTALSVVRAWGCIRSVVGPICNLVLVGWTMWQVRSIYTSIALIYMHAWSVEGSDHIESYACNLSLHFCKRLFPNLNP